MRQTEGCANSRRGTQNKVLITLLALAVLASVVKDLNRLHSWASVLLSDSVQTAHASDLSLAEPSCPKTQHLDRFRRVVNVMPGQSIAIDSINGDVDGLAALGGGVEGTAGIANGSAIANVRHNEVRVIYGVRVLDRTNSGEIRTKSSSCSVDSHTANSYVNVSTTDAARSKRSYSEIRANREDRKWPQALEFKTGKGGIELELPRALSTKLEASIASGEIPSDFPLTVLNSITRKRVTTGTGAHELVLRTINDNVRVRRAS